MHKSAKSLSKRKTFLVFTAMFSTSAIIAQPTLPETNIWNLPGISNMHDVVINCDMLQSYQKEDGSPSTIKAIAWDNGERYQTTGNQAETLAICRRSSWFYSNYFSWTKHQTTRRCDC